MSDQQSDFAAHRSLLDAALCGWPGREGPRDGRAREERVGGDAK